MKFIYTSVQITLLFLFGTALSVFGQVPSPKSFETQHVWQSGGKTIPYRVVAAETPLTNAEGDTTALLWSTSYFKADKNPNRPVTFVFNGGPGSASVWLHLGFLGPKVVRTDSNA